MNIKTRKMGMKSLKKIRKHKKRKSTMRHRNSNIIQTKQYGGDDTDDKKNEIKAYISVLDEFIKKQKTSNENGKNTTNLEGLKYNMFKDKFKEFENVKNKFEKGIETTEEDLLLLKTLVFLVIKDDVSEYQLLFNKNIAGFQTMIHNFLMYLINDSPFEEEVRMKLLEGIINKKPFVKIDYKKKDHNNMFDVNELFANIQNEIKQKISYNPVIYEKIMKIDGTLEPVSEPVPEPVSEPVSKKT